MPTLQPRQDKIKAIKKAHEYKTFLQEVVSRFPLMIYKNQNLLSIYPETERACPVVTTREFEENRSSYTDHGLDYDFGINFFDNFKKLYDTTPLSALLNRSGTENCDFAFGAYMSKNCYLSFSIITDCENVLYGFTVKEHCSDVLNSSQVRNYCQNVYMCLGIINSTNVFYSRFIQNSSDIRFCSNMVGCHHCIMCDDMENESYCIKNKKYEKDEYLKKAKEVLDQKKMYADFYAQVKYEGKNYGSTDVTGSFLLKSQDVENGYYSLEMKDAKNLLVVGGSKLNEHMYDVFEAGAHGNSDFYGTLDAGVKSDNLYNCDGIATCSNAYYCRFLENCNYCIGCIGLKNKEFCILNKEYPKEERFALADKIFAQMEQDGNLGQFFPASLNPFYFNDTVAYLVGDFSKEEVIKAGFLRREDEIKADIPAGADVLTTKDLAGYQGFDEKGERTINPEILKKVVKDSKGNCYRIVKMEYDFLVKHGLPLPELHWLDRIKLGFKLK